MRSPKQMLERLIQHRMTSNMRAMDSPASLSAACREVAARQKMQELGLKGLKHAFYFWEVSEKGEETEIKFFSLKPVAARRGRFLIPRYTLSSAHGSKAGMIEYLEDNTPVYRDVEVRPQTLRSAPGLEGLLDPASEETLRQANAWLSALNQQAEAAYQRELGVDSRVYSGHLAGDLQRVEIERFRRISSGC